jgi:hypothetical protein
MTSCVTEFGPTSDSIFNDLDQLVKIAAKSPLDLLDPCTAFAIHQKTTEPPKYEPYEHPDYKGIHVHMVYFTGWRG